MKQDVTVLRPEEPARFNPDRLELLCKEVGEVRAEHEVASALEVISRRLRDIRDIDPWCDAPSLAGLVRALIAASDRIGMATLSRVARDVQRCAARRDAVALAATYMRLLRVGDRSIKAIWDLEDASG
ncbi:MAG: hypothetical protein COW55_00090 [Rhodobacteraceae bacterium CG17_big_fil_post_rev_8_21_14_2_50_65_11]|nr:MAG: hypothetical protein COW55_00090 [Rhodobacteraceae bacterium CG17_big_fil_post_rev_8_21_14_2_50_65_11]